MGVADPEFEELKRAALEQSQKQRSQLDKALEERARKKRDDERVQSERANQRAEWMARERLRREKQRALDQERIEMQKDAQKRREAAARAAEKAAIEKAVGRTAKRAPALDKARSVAVQHRSQVRRPRETVTALTREEKRMKRMAKDMGVPFRPQKVRVRSDASEAAPSQVHTLAPRHQNAREEFIAQERRRKELRHQQREEEDEEEDEDSDEDDVEPGPSHASIRDQIWQLFGRNRQAYVRITNT